MTAEHKTAIVADEVLGTFWNLTEQDSKVRYAATEELINRVVSAQKTHSETNSDSKYSPLLRYCLGRLFAGLASDQFMVREAFSVALTSLMRAMPILTLADYLNMMDTHLKLKEQTSTKDYTDICIGRLLAYGVCLQLGIQYQQGFEGVLHISNGLFSIYSVRGLHELCVITITDLLMHCDDTILQDLFEKCETLKLLCTKPTDLASPEDLYICFSLWDRLPSNLLDKTKLLPKKHQPSQRQWFKNLDESFSKLSKAFFQEKHLMAMIPILEKSASSHPRLHVIWEMLLPMLVHNIKKFSFDQNQSKIQLFWKFVICHLSKGDTKERHLAQCLSLRIMQRLNAGYLPLIIRGCYWNEVVSAFHSETHLLHMSSSTCIQKVTELVKQAPKEKASTFLPMLICRFPPTQKCKSIRQELIEMMRPELMDSYVDDLVHCLLGFPDADKRANLHISEIADFDVAEVLKDLKTLFRVYQPSRKTAESVLTILTALGLHIVNSIKYPTDKTLELLERSTVDINEEFRQGCMMCLMHCCLYIECSWFKESPNDSPLAPSIDLIHAEGIDLFHEDSAAYSAQLSIIQKMQNDLSCKWSQCKEHNGKRQIKCLYDLVCVVELYFLGHTESIDSHVFQELSKIVDSFLIEIDQEERSFMDALIEVLIGLSTRKTDPYSMKLLLKFVKACFISFSSEINLRSWIILLEALTNTEEFELEMDEDDMVIDMPYDQSEPKSSADDSDAHEQEEELTSEEENLNEMGMFLEEVDLHHGDTKWSNQEEIQNKWNEDMSSVTLRILSYVETVLKKNSQKDYVLITPIYLLKALKTNNRDIKERFEKVFCSSLKCKPRIRHEDLAPFGELILKFVKEIPSPKEAKKEASMVFRFLLSRIMASCDGQDQFLALSVELMKLAIQQHFRKSSPPIQAESILSLLSQYKDIRQGIFTFLVEKSLEIKNAYQKMKALQFVYICVRDKESKIFSKILLSSKIGHLLIKSIDALPNTAGRVYFGILQILRNILTSISSVMKQVPTEIVPKDELGAAILRKLEEAETTKLMKKLQELDSLVKKLF